MGHYFLDTQYVYEYLMLIGEICEGFVKALNALVKRVLKKNQ